MWPALETYVDNSNRSVCMQENEKWQQNSPRFPTRPVRPMRWTYSSMSLGKSKLMTCFTLEMSSPRAATWSTQKHHQLNKHKESHRRPENSDCTHSSGNHDGASSRTKLVKCLLTITLRAVAMDTGAGIALAVEEVLKSVCSLLSLHKH